MTVMQERFRFRIWLEYENKMISPEDENADSICLFAYNQHGNLLKFVSNNEVIWARIGHTIYDEHIMQCTGLKDKNGKLIYENDIVKVLFVYPIIENTISLKETNLAIVEYYNGCFTAKYVDDNTRVYLYQSNESIEVVGNVFENEELLKNV